MFLALLLTIPGILLLATPALPAGLLMIVAGWWVYERSGLRESETFATILLLLGGLGAMMVVVQAAWQWVVRTLL